MSKLRKLTALCLLLSIPPVSVAADRVGDFALLDQAGYFHHMSWYGDAPAVALLVHAVDDPATLRALPDYQALHEQYADQGIEFFMLNPMGRHNRDAVTAELQELGVDIPVLMDDTQVVSEALGVAQTGEILLFDPASFTVIFQGPAGESLERAITEVLAGQEIGTPVVASSGGTPVTYAFQDWSLSYEKDIAPIIADNCASCHREGGIAPFAMDSHGIVRGWSPMIREVVMTKRMPPAQVDPHIGDFDNAMNLEFEEVQKLIAWIDAGAEKSPQEGDPLTALTWPESVWAFGEPDLIIDIPAQHVPATGVLEYRNIVVPIDIDQDRWVRGSQYVAGDRSVLHHTINRVIPPDSNRRPRRGEGDPDGASITAYIPGAEPRLNPPNTGGLLKKGSKLSVQLHYTTNGKETVDESRIGVWFYPEGVVPEDRMAGECACIFTADWTNIPPHDPAFEQTASIVIPRDAELYGHGAHMHFRGKYMRFYADYPDGSREELLNIANYSYNWQLNYEYSQPKFVPAGTRITAVGAFDNSARNPANPDPDRSVPWGQMSWDEMFFGSSRWKYVNTGSD